MTGPSAWWDPHIYGDRRPLLLARGSIREACRSFFLKEDFVEVECGALQISPGNEAHLHAFATESIAPDGSRTRLYLHTSPEFAAKKLLAAGEKRIFEFARVFRNRERGPLHAPEFTMLEWYRAKEPYACVVEDSIRIIKNAAEITGIDAFSYREKTADPRLPPERITVQEAFGRYAGIDLLSTLDHRGSPNTDALANAAKASKISTAADDNWSDIFSRILVERVEPKLGAGRVTVLDEYPRAEAALARPCPHDPRVAERFEIYACGVELANGFGELTDANEQRARFAAEMEEKQRRYGERYPIDEEFLAALSKMPDASGVALGFDRLVMLATGASRIEQVMWTPFTSGGS